MRITHTIGNKERSVEGDAKLFLTNKKGNYLSLGTPQTSDFDGLFTYDSRTNNLFKILHDIRIAGIPTEIHNCLSWAERKTNEATERFFLTSNACIYEIEGYAGAVTLTLDCKQLYDDSAEKRIYTTSPETIADAPALHVHYTKYLGLIPRYTRHVLITAEPREDGEPTIQSTRYWKEALTPYDEQRGMPGSRWVYDACTVQVRGPTRIFVTSSNDYKKAKEKMRYVLDNQESIIAGNRKYPEQRFANTDFEEALVMNALDVLVTKRKHKSARGVFAGLPWFFQYWMRDEAMSLHALVAQKQYALVKEIIMRWVDTIGEYDTASLKGSPIDTADGPGILAKRTQELFTQLKKEKQLEHFFTEEELFLIKKTYETYLNTLTTQHVLVTSGTNETWMDTNPFGDGRSGTRIEIQTLILCIYDLLIFLNTLLKQKNKELFSQREELLSTTKEWFYDSRGWLIDGFFSDGTVDIRTRPNAFLAWYFQPQLLSKEEWTNVFKSALDKLWLPWGGLASIGHDDPHFHKKHTGINNESYHYGDSWYFINNIAAMALFSIDPHEFGEYIEKILAASTRDLLGQGYAGYASEISDAQEQNPQGCFAQAWSAATLIELMNLLRR